MARVSTASICEPCDPLSAAAKQMDLRSCCRGTTNDECGLTFGEGALCLNRDGPGQARPRVQRDDGRRHAARRAAAAPTGAAASSPASSGWAAWRARSCRRALGGGGDPVFCNAECDTDGDCEGTGALVRCAENDDRSARYCALDCLRDRDCPRGLICALTNDVAMDRVLAICREPVGDQIFGEFCSAATDCVAACA